KLFYASDPPCSEVVLSNPYRSGWRCTLLPLSKASILPISPIPRRNPRTRVRLLRTRAGPRRSTGPADAAYFLRRLPSPDIVLLKPLASAAQSATSRAYRGRRLSRVAIGTPQGTCVTVAASSGNSPSDLASRLLEQMAPEGLAGIIVFFSPVYDAEKFAVE